MARTVRKCSERGGRFWRITSQSRLNIELAAKSKQWGAPTRLGMMAVRPGDRIAFYVSKGPLAGYWGTATASSEVFISRTPIWPEEIYPFRFKFKLDGKLRSLPLTNRELMQHLPSGRLTSYRRTSIAPLTASEFKVIAQLLSDGKSIAQKTESARRRPKD